MLGPSVAHLEKAHEAVAGMAMQFLAWYQGGRMEQVPLAAETFLEMMSELAVGWLLLEGAMIALEAQRGVTEGHPDRHFYEGRRHAAVHYAQSVLPTVPAKARILAGGDRSPLEIPDEAFATV